MNLLSIWKTLAFHTKASLVFTILVFISVPITVLSVNAIRDSRIRAASFGDPNYPDPSVQFNTTPHWLVQVCNAGQPKGSTTQCQRSETDGFGDSGNASIGPKQTGSLLQVPGRGYDYYVDVLVRADNNLGVYFIGYQRGSFTGACFSTAAYCLKTVSWNTPVFSILAYKQGNINEVCVSDPKTYCISHQDLRFTNSTLTAQFQDFPNSIYFDTRLFVTDVNGIKQLLDFRPGTFSGTIGVTSKPTLSVPTYGQTGVTTISTPFAWTAVPGASRYALWVSTSANFASNGFWYKSISPTSCNSTGCISNWSIDGWLTQNGTSGAFPVPPTVLDKGKTYYWSVWACNVADCPNAGLSSPSYFTTEAPPPIASLPSVAALVDSDSQTSVPSGVWGTTHKFQWTGANADQFAVDISSDQNFASGHFVNRILNVTKADALATYSVLGDSGWINQGTATYSANGQLALQEGTTYYWRVYAKNIGGAIYNIPQTGTSIPNLKITKPPLIPVAAKPASPTSLVDTDALLSVPSGRWGATHKFSWNGSSTTEFNILISSDKTFTTNYVKKTMPVALTRDTGFYFTYGDSGWVTKGTVDYNNAGKLNLAETTTYYWWVWAKNSAGEVYSVIDQLDKPPLSTPTTATKPSQPYSLNTNIKALICGTNGVIWGSGLRFSWKGTNAASYAVDVSESSNFAGFANKVVSGTQLSLTGDRVGGDWKDNFTSTPLTVNRVLALSPAKTYFWRVWAKNSAGEVFDVTYAKTDGATETGTPANFNKELCATSIAVTLQSPIGPDQSPQPSFVWKPNSQAAYYGLAVSDNHADLISATRLWKSYLGALDCSTTSCVRNWTDLNWYSVGNIGAKPLMLTAGKTYYYFVWSCTTVTCPLTGFVESSFTVAGTLVQSPPSDLRVSFSSVPGHLSWLAAKPAVGTIDHYRVLLKQSEGNKINTFNEGGYWIKDVSTKICTGTTDPKLCLSPLNASDGTWNWESDQNGTINPNYIPAPLFKGNWNWMVIACTNPSCDIFHILFSPIASFNISSYQDGVVATTANQLITQSECSPDGRSRTINIAWKSGTLFTSAKSLPTQILDYSIYDNNFLAGTFANSVPTPSVFSPNTAFYTTINLPASTTFNWRVNTNRDGYPYFSDTQSFRTKDCPIAPTTSIPKGVTGDGSWDDLANYIANQTAEIADPKVPGVSLTKVMWDTVSNEDGTLFSSGNDLQQRNKGLCAAGGNGEIGVFQFMAPTWNSTGKKVAGLDGGSGSTTYFNKGSINGWNGCWKIPGRDTNSEDPLVSPYNGKYYDYETTNGVNIDNGAWNPYSQVEAAVVKFKAGNHCEWGGFKIAYPGYC